MKELLGVRLKQLIIEQGVNNYWAEILQSILAVIFLIILAYFADLIVRKILIKIVTKLVRKTKTQWDDVFLEHQFFHRLAHFAPVVIFYKSAELIDQQSWSTFIENGAYICMVIIALMLLSSFMNVVNDIYNTMPISKSRPIKGYLQVITIFFYALAVVSIFALLFNKSPFKIIMGMGAFAAVLILVFKDTILGFVASIQLSANKMVNIGDWISMPGRKTDGVVLDITLNTVKVQNWDKTISTVPTYALVSESFNNWKGMEQSGGRRIKRHINIDMKTIHFLSPDEIKKFEKINLISNYIKNIVSEIEKENINNEMPVNQRRLTNVGTFRKYVEAYLNNNPKIHKQMTFLVRQLQPTEKGLPLEIYVFSNDQAWANYETIQADIFDHILAIVPEFNLKIFQNPTGDDFQKLIN